MKDDSVSFTDSLLPGTGRDSSDRGQDISFNRSTMVQLVNEESNHLRSDINASLLENEDMHKLARSMTKIQH